MSPRVGDLLKKVPKREKEEEDGKIACVKTQKPREGNTSPERLP
jgi:hypothetical protein